MHKLSLLHPCRDILNNRPKLFVNSYSFVLPQTEDQTEMHEFLTAAFRDTCAFNMTCNFKDTEVVCNGGVKAMQAFLNCLPFHSICRLHFFTVCIEATYTHDWCFVKWVTFNAAGAIVCHWCNGPI